MSPDLFFYLYVPVILWSLGIIIVMIYLIKKYPLGNWTPENPNPYEGETFGMPRGTMRGILTLSLIFVVMLLEVISPWDKELESKIDQLLVAFQMMIAFYFGSKVMHHVTNADERKAKIKAEMSQAPTGNFEDSTAVG